MKLLIEFPDDIYPSSAIEKGNLFHMISALVGPGDVHISEFHDSLDLTAIPYVGVQVRADGKVLWVNTERGCVLRICQIGRLKIEDMRAPKTPLSKILRILRNTRGLSADSIIKLEKLTQKRYDEW